MVVGDGDIGTILKQADRDDILFFVSGVSNSQCEDEAEYKRERDLLLDQRRDLRIVYVSSLAVLYSKTRYAQHKRDMELMVKANFPDHCIIRIGNISWGSNPHTLINYLRAHPNAELQDVFRYVVDEDEFLYWVGIIPDFNIEMHIPGKRLKVREIYEQYVKEQD